MVKEIKSAKVETLLACIVALAMVLGSACTREPHHEDGIIEMKAATGVVARTRPTGWLNYKGKSKTTSIKSL